MEAITENILNVTLLEPRQKHPTIFVRFDELAPGQSLTIHNDHDPKPLYYQLLGERGNVFVWEYLEEGPVWWKVRISKRKEGESEETLGAIAAKDMRKAQVFKKYGLDFCCGGKKTVKEACAEKGLDVTRVEKELQQTDENYVSRPLPFQDWSLDFLADYIVNTHHTFVRKTVPQLLELSAKVARVHGAHHPELPVIAALVEDISNELQSHLVKEEQVVFPYIKKLAQTKAAPAEAAELGGILAPINLMEMEHEAVGEKLAEIRTLSNNFALPVDACASYSLVYRMLEDFEDDMFNHIHLENNILFPKAIELEKELA